VPCATAPPSGTGIWPCPLTRLRDGLLKKLGGDRQFVEILCAAQQHGLEAVAVACELALEQHTPSAAAVLNVASIGCNPTRRGLRSPPLSG
jgi:hypothetical protein